MAEYMVVEEVEETSSCIYQDRENPVDTMSDARNLLESVDFTVTLF